MRYIILSITLLCVACTSALPSFKPYKMDIQQGNVVTSKMMLQLRPGMSKSQVRFVMGTPLIQDSFHRDRWDYFYQMRKDGKIIEQRRVILEFDNEALVRVRGDVVPAGSSQDVADPSPISSKKPEEKRGLTESLQFWKGQDKSSIGKPQEAPSELVNPAVREPAAPKAAEPASQPAEISRPQAGTSAEPKTEITPKAETPKPTPAKPATQPVSEGKPAPVESKPLKSAAPAGKPADKATAKPAEPEKELPPEDEPGYFERMLEKIGF